MTNIPDNLLHDYCIKIKDEINKQNLIKEGSKNITDDSYDKLVGHLNTYINDLFDKMNKDGKIKKNEIEKQKDEIEKQRPDKLLINDDNENEKANYLYKLYKFALIVKSYIFKKDISKHDEVDEYFNNKDNINEIMNTFKTMMGAVYFPTFDVMKNNIELRISELKKSPNSFNRSNYDNYIIDTNNKDNNKRFIINKTLLAEDIYNQNFKNEFNRFMKEFLNEKLGKVIQEKKASPPDIDEYKKLSKKYSDNVKFLYGYLSDKVEMMYEDSKNLKIDAKKVGELNLLYKLMELYNSQSSDQGRTFLPIINIKDNPLYNIKEIPNTYTFLDENSLFYAKTNKKAYYTKKENEYIYSLDNKQGSTEVTPGHSILDIDNDSNNKFRNDIAQDCAVYYYYDKNKKGKDRKRELILTTEMYNKISKNEGDYNKYVIKERKIISKTKYDKFKSDIHEKKNKYISKEGLVNVEYFKNANSNNVETKYEDFFKNINVEADFNSVGDIGKCIHKDLNNAVNNIEEKLKNKALSEVPIEDIPFYFFVSAINSKTWQAGIHSSLLILHKGKYYSFGFGYNDEVSVGLKHMVETINGAIYTPDYLIASDLYSSSDFNKQNPFASKAFKYKIGDYGIFNKEMYDRTINILKNVNYEDSFYAADQKCFMLPTPEIKYCELSGQGTSTSNCSNFALTVVGGDRINCDLRLFTNLPYFFKGMLIDLPYYCVRNNLTYYNPTEFVIELFNCYYNEKDSDEYKKSFNKMIKWCDIQIKNKLFRFFGDKASYVPGVVLQAYRAVTKKKGGKKSNKTTRRRHRNNN